jgi:3-(3-hydroxy-phenyl)propionate hydroxylase
MYDVAIVGMGPVGCSAAILLNHAGLRVAAIERDTQVYQLPRAVNLDGEIIRAMQPVGLADAIDNLMQSVRPGDRAGFANSKREYLFGNDLLPFGANGWQPSNMFDQPELEAFLRTTALNHQNLDAFIGFTATAFEDTGAEVSIHIAREHQTETITAQYLLACDGAASFTRKQLGIGWQDLGYNHDWLVVDVTTLPGHTLGNTTMQVCDPDRITTFVASKDPYRRWEFKLRDGETWDEMLDEENIHGLIETWTPRNTYTIRRAAMYQFHAATADTWRRGRIFLAGDAAHQTPPFLGQGMNAGMRDVVNLSWKLPMVLAGKARDSLLDSYEAERKAHAHDLVEWAVSIGQLMEHLAAVEAAERQGLTPPQTPTRLKSSGYGQGREAPPLRAGVLIEDQVSDRGVTGYLLAQPIVTKDNVHHRFDDLLQSGFAIVGRSQADTRVAEPAASMIAHLGIQTVSLEGLQEVRGHIDRAFEYTPALIVRPDRYVFGHVDEHHTLDQLVMRLANKLQLI